MRSVALAALALGGLSAAVWGGEATAPAKSADKHWSFQPPRRGTPPAVKDAAWVRNPIDQFVLARLEAAGLTPSPEAARACLIRRLAFDLTGLPPTPAEVEAFVKDTDPNAYEKLVDHYLASPRYGEHWATYWLDLVRFAESDGFRADDPRPTAWRYRDYVIQSLNADKPYDRFVKEQLAGDELFPDDPDALVATGYLRLWPDEWNQNDLELRRQEILNDITDTTAQAFLGLTVGCCRCHDHKFDPIAQTEYYQFQAFFAAYKPVEVMTGDAVEREKYRLEQAAREAKVAELRKQQAELEKPYLAKQLTARRSRFIKEYQEAYDTPPEKRTPHQEQIAYLVGKQFYIADGVLSGSIKAPADRDRRKALVKQIEEVGGPVPADPHAPAMTDVGPVAPPTYLLKRGDLRKPGDEVSPGVPAAAGGPALPAIKPTARTTGRRKALANWLTDPKNPLTARVLVNRLWQHHFGRGIVGTPGDFGTQGDAPSHPELLDWLASEFVAPSPPTAVGGLSRPWSLKHMHRLIVTSAAYRQAGAWRKDAGTADPENKLVWRMNRRRLQGEALRDAMLAASGRLNPKMGGPSVLPELPGEMVGDKSTPAWPLTKDAVERDHRSVYVFVKRNLRYPFFAVFDAPDRTDSCSRRNVSTSAPQALFLLNDGTAVDLARSLAGRVLRESEGKPEAVVERTYRLALGRAPCADEVKEARRFLGRTAALLADRMDSESPPPLPADAPGSIAKPFAAAVVDFCHALLNSNEFLYVD